jgi:rare lipoprotein A
MLFQRLILPLVVGAVVALALAWAYGEDEATAGDTVQASYYGEEMGPNARTASGSFFDPNGYTAAHKSYPFGTRLLVTYQGNRVPVTVTDRGPFSGNRELDLSRGAAEKIGLTSAGVDAVEIEELPSGAEGETSEELPETGGKL